LTNQSEKLDSYVKFYDELESASKLKVSMKGFENSQNKIRRSWRNNNSYYPRNNKKYNLIELKKKIEQKKKRRERAIEKENSKFHEKVDKEKEKEKENQEKDTKEGDSKHDDEKDSEEDKKAEGVEGILIKFKNDFKSKCQNNQKLMKEKPECFNFLQEKFKDITFDS